MTTPSTIPHWSLAWSVVPAASLPRGRARPRAMLALVAHDLPDPPETYHFAFARRADGAWIACALPRQRLGALDHAARAPWTPDDIPGFVLGPGDAPDRLRAALNLARGLPPSPAARTRRRRARIAAGALTLAAWAGLVVGLHRRETHWALEEARLRDREHAVVDQALGPGPGVPALRMQAALRAARAMEATNHTPAQHAGPDPALTLASLCSTWPTPGPTLERLSVDASGVMLVAQAGTLPGATELVNALALPGLAPPTHQLAAAPAGVRLTMRWTLGTPGPGRHP